jgi:hypothetical protein
MLKSISDVMQAGLEAYTERKVVSIQVYPDPSVSETWAARAVMVEGDTIDFFVVGSQLPRRMELTRPDAIADAIEECMFDQWPPAAGPLRFL